jgi:hypothetical protein
LGESVRSPKNPWLTAAILFTAALLNAPAVVVWAQAPAAAPSPMKRMPDEADPTFEVATIKPNESGAANIQMFRFGQNDFETRNSSLVDLIARAYGVQARQITADRSG